MTDFEAYQEYIQRKHNAFCKAVIRYAARDKILQLRRKWERQISLDYLMDEKFVQFAGPEPDEEYPFTVCGQTVLLCNADSCRRALRPAAADAGSDFALLLPAPAAASDRRTYRPDAQHSGAAYPACPCGGLREEMEACRYE